jgi:hypothetical protein
MDNEKLIAFDIEIAKEIPTFAPDWQVYEPLGISCLALALSGEGLVIFRQGKPQMDAHACREVVAELQDYVDHGYSIITWNGCKFDFNVLAQESGMVEECVQLALDHIDLMMMVTFMKGHYLSLQAALNGSGLGGKLKSVTLSDGTILKNMDGAKAPGMWAKGEYEAVLAYLKEDVLQLLALAEMTVKTKSLRWLSRSGNRQKIPVHRLLKARECFKLPEPDVSWQHNPPRRSDFVSWMPQEIIMGLY